MHCYADSRRSRSFWKAHDQSGEVQGHFPKLLLEYRDRERNDAAVGALASCGCRGGLCSGGDTLEAGAGDALLSNVFGCRDVKPENLLVRFTEGTGGTPEPHVRLIDLGSAVDAFSGKELYGEKGPSSLEHTQEYAPPEALLGR